jgi:hypothetical protein
LTITALNAASDLERMGDLAVHVAKIAARRAPQVAAVPEIRDIISRMADCAAQIRQARWLRSMRAKLSARAASNAGVHGPHDLRTTLPR